MDVQSLLVWQLFQEEKRTNPLLSQVLCQLNCLQDQYKNCQKIPREQF